MNNWRPGHFKQKNFTCKLSLCWSRSWWEVLCQGTIGERCLMLCTNQVVSLKTSLILHMLPQHNGPLTNSTSKGIVKYNAHHAGQSLQLKVIYLWNQLYYEHFFAFCLAWYEVYMYDKSICELAFTMAIHVESYIDSANAAVCIELCFLLIWSMLFSMPLLLVHIFVALLICILFAIFGTIIIIITLHMHAHYYWCGLHRELIRQPFQSLIFRPFVDNPQLCHSHGHSLLDEGDVWERL